MLKLITIPTIHCYVHFCEVEPNKSKFNSITHYQLQIIYSKYNSQFIQQLLIILLISGPTCHIHYVFESVLQLATDLQPAALLSLPLSLQNMFIADLQPAIVPALSPSVPKHLGKKTAPISNYKMMFWSLHLFRFTSNHINLDTYIKHIQIYIH